MTKTCPRCGAENAEGAVICQACGATLAVLADTTISLPSEREEGEARARQGAPGVAAELSPMGQPHLVVVKGPNPGVQFLLEREQIAIGRDPESDIFLNDVTVSRRHATIRVSPGKVALQDVGSLNGTYVNGKRVDSTELRGGDEVQIGKYKLVLLLGRD